MAPDGVSVHAARIPIVDLQTYSDPPGSDDAGQQLAKLPLHGIVFAFATTGYRLSGKGELLLKARFEKRSKGIDDIHTLMGRHSPRRRGSPRHGRPT
jgi:hypothetical protein